MSVLAIYYDSFASKINLSKLKASKNNHILHGNKIDSTLFITHPMPGVLILIFIFF